MYLPQDRQCTLYAYDEVGRLTKKTLPNGVYTEYTYNNVNNLLTLTNKNSGGAAISSFAYTHDNVGNRLSMAASSGTHTYTYDSTYRLTTSDHPVGLDESFTYDKVGNRKSSSEYPSWNYDANNRLTSYDGATFTYDKNGNTITKVKAGTTNYSYDYENRLTQISGLTSASYTYDPFGKRLSKTAGGVTTYYRYDKNHRRTLGSRD